MNDMTPQDYAKAVGTEVRAQMARQRKNQTDLAEALSITPATAARRLDGASPFSVLELAVVAAWLDVSIDSLRPSDDGLARANA